MLQQVAFNNSSRYSDEVISEFRILYQERVGRCQKVCVEGGGGGHTDTYIYVPSVKNQHKRDVTGYNGYLRNSNLCQFIEIFHKIINWYMKDAK